MFDTLLAQAQEVEALQAIYGEVRLSLSRRVCLRRDTDDTLTGGPCSTVCLLEGIFPSYGNYHFMDCRQEEGRRKLPFGHPEEGYITSSPHELP